MRTIYRGSFIIPQPIHSITTSVTGLLIGEYSKTLLMSKYKGMHESQSYAKLNRKSRSGGFQRTYTLFYHNAMLCLTLPAPLIQQMDGWFIGASLDLYVEDNRLHIRMAKQPTQVKIKQVGGGLALHLPEFIVGQLGWRTIEQITIRMERQIELIVELYQKRGRRYHVQMTRDEYIQLILSHPNVPQPLRDQHITEASFLTHNYWQLLPPTIEFVFEVEVEQGDRSPLQAPGPIPPAQRYEGGVTTGENRDDHPLYDEFDLTKLQKFIDEVPADDHEQGRDAKPGNSHDSAKEGKGDDQE